MNTRITLFIICFVAILTIRKFVLNPEEYLPTSVKMDKQKSKNAITEDMSEKIGQILGENTGDEVPAPTQEEVQQ